ncbi:V-type ATP synthase subunit I [Clostridia bacterium]|nr:V-type ATP synthase subunit I [Clostridia bacterium]
MIAKMNKFTLLTFSCNKDALLKELQKHANAHFGIMDETEGLRRVYAGAERSKLEEKLSKVDFALAKIEEFRAVKKGISAYTAPSPELDFDEFDSFAKRYDYNSVYENIKAADSEIKLLRMECAKLSADNLALTPWLKLDVSAKTLDTLKSTRYALGTMPKTMAETFAENLSEESYMEILDGTKDESGVLIVTLEDDFDAVLTLAKTSGFTSVSLALPETPRELQLANQRRIKEMEQLEENESEKIKEYAGEYDNLKTAADYFNTAIERAKASENFMRTKDFYVAEGWAAAVDIPDIEKAVKSVCSDEYYFESEEVEKDSAEVPIKLYNNKLVAPFETITEMYSLPKYNEIDPTPLLTPFYLLFFGTMVGDAGYGLVLFLISLFALKKCNLKPSMRRFMRFFNYLGVSTMLIGGICFGSVFGFTVIKLSHTADGIPKAIFDTSLDIVTMLIIAVAIGVFQIIFGLAIKGYMLVRDGKIKDAVFDSLFWITTVMSLVGLITCTAVGNAALASVSKWVLILSVVGLACTQGRRSPSIGGKIGNGIYSVYSITSYVGDFVSYTRLVALALSGAYIAYSFNLMGGFMPINDANDTLMSGAVRMTGGLLIALFGGVLNLGLCALGAYVHTCRLQYVEYFGKFYEGGGKPFRPFALKNTFVKIK